MPTISQFIVWAIIGLIGGWLASTLITWDRDGFGGLRNFALGLVGALIGGALFKIFDILPGLGAIAISLREIVAAVVGSLIAVAALWFMRRRERQS